MQGTEYVVPYGATNSGILSQYTTQSLAAWPVTSQKVLLKLSLVMYLKFSFSCWKSISFCPKLGRNKTSVNISITVECVGLQSGVDPTTRRREKRNTILFSAQALINLLRFTDKRTRKLGEKFLWSFVYTELSEKEKIMAEKVHSSSLDDCQRST